MINKAKVIFADSRRLGDLLPEKSVDLVVTGPPYWNEVVYSDHDSQLSKIADYQSFLAELSKVWSACSGVLKDGGIVALWVHDFLRKEENLFRYVPFHSDILKTFDSSFNLRIIYVWDRYLNKDRGEIINAGLGIGTKVQYIIVLQKKGESKNHGQIEESLRKMYWQPVWTQKTSPKIFGSRLVFKILFNLGKLIGFRGFGERIRGKLVNDGYKFRDYTTECPKDVPDLLIKSFSSSEDTILDPFVGSGTTLKSAIKLKRNCVGIEVNKNAEASIKKKLKEAGLELSSS